MGKRINHKCLSNEFLKALNHHIKPSGLNVWPSITPGARFTGRYLISRKYAKGEHPHGKRTEVVGRAYGETIIPLFLGQDLSGFEGETCWDCGVPLLKLSKKELMLLKLSN